MGLSYNLISQFAKITNSEKEQKKESNTYGTIVKYGDANYVRIDGSDLLTPYNSTVAVKDGDKVSVKIKNHTVIVTGSTSNPAASNQELGVVKTDIKRFKTIVADKVATSDLEAINAYIENLDVIAARVENFEAGKAKIDDLRAKYANMEYIDANDIKAINADLETLKSLAIQSQSITAEDLTAINAQITNLNSYNAKFTYVSADVLKAIKANIQELDVNKLDANTANILYAKINELQALDADIQRLNARKISVEDADILYAKIAELNAIKAIIQQLDVDKLNANDADILYAKIAELDAIRATIQQLDVDKLNANDADILYAKITELQAINADIHKLHTDKLDANSAEIMYANIDFENVDLINIGKLFAKSGIIKDIITETGTITGELVGVTIKGDLIEGNTLKADKLVIQGEDGLYYKLNIDGLNNISTTQASKFTLILEEPDDWNSNYKKYYTINNGQYVHITGNTPPIWNSTDYYKLSSTHESGLDGTNIIAQTITADKITVSDLVAFGATIGGFHIGDHSLYSGVKTSALNTTRGIFMNDSGEFSIGDSSNYFRYFYDENTRTYKMEISASSLKISATNKTIEETIEEIREEMTTNLVIESSRGTVFKNNQASTVLSVIIYRGNERITNITDLRTAMGNNVYLQWKWRRLTDNDYGVISINDSHISENGFKYTISPSDIDTQVTYMCELIKN